MIVGDMTINPDKWAAFRIAVEDGGHVLIRDQYWIIGWPASYEDPPHEGPARIWLGVFDPL